VNPRCPNARHLGHPLFWERMTLQPRHPGHPSAECGGCRGAVTYGVKRVGRAAIVGRVAGDVLVVELVDAVVAPLQRASALLSGVGAVAGEAERVFVIGNLRSGRGRGQLGNPVQLVVGAGGRDAVGIGDRDHVAGIVIRVAGGVVAGQTVIDHRTEPVEAVVGVADVCAVGVGGLDAFHLAH